MAVRKIRRTLSSIVAGETRPALMAGSKVARFMNFAEGISRSRPALAAATPS